MENTAKDKTREPEKVKIYFAYSGRDMDKESGEPAKKVIENLTQPGANGQVYAVETSHPPSNGKKKKTLREKLRTRFHKSKMIQRIAALIVLILGEWAVDKITSKWRIRDWRVAAEKLIESSDVLVFLYSKNSWNKENAENIMWEIAAAKRLDLNVITCSIDEDELQEAPDWVKDIDDKAVNYPQAKLRDEIEHYSLRQYNFSSEVQPGTDPVKAEERMFEQYKLYREETAKLTETRQTVTNFYLLINGALLTLIGVVLGPAATSADTNWLFVLAVVNISSIVGIVISHLWLRMVKYYKNLNTAKQRLINAIEKKLPLQLNSTEYYEIMKSPLNKGRYKSFGEAVIPDTIHALWGILFILSLLLAVLIPLITHHPPVPSGADALLSSSEVLLSSSDTLFVVKYTP